MALRFWSLSFKLHRAEMLQGGVPRPGMIRALEVDKTVGFCLIW